MSILDNIVGLYNFNGDANDSSGNGFHGVVSGAILTNDNLGNSNSAYLYDGGDIITCDNVLSTIGQEFTLSAFIYPTTISGVQRIFISTNDRLGLHLSSGGVFQAYVHDGTYRTCAVSNTTAEIAVNTWTHVLCTYSSNLLKIYSNGVFRNQLAVTGPINTTTSCYIGNWSSRGQGFIGIIAKAKIYNRALSDAEILQVCNTGRGVHSEIRGGMLSNSISNIGIDTTGIVAMYNFNGNANDSSGNGYNGTVIGATLTTNRFGDTNSAYSFNGTSDYISLAEEPFDILGDTTFLFSFTTSSYVNGQRIYSKYSGSSTGHVEIYEAVPGVIQAIFRTATVNAPLNSQLLQINTWYDVAVTFNNTTGDTRIYVNGTLSSSNVQGTGILNNTRVVLLGRNANSDTDYYNGTLGYFYKFNRILSDAEIMQLANVKRGVHSLTKGTQIVNHTDNIGVDISSLSALYNVSGVDVTGNGNTGLAGLAVTYSEDTYGNYIDFNGDKNFSLGTGTLAIIGIGNKMNYNQTNDFSWFVTHSILSPQPSNGSGVFGSAYDNAVYISNVVGAVTVTLRGSTNVSIGVGSNYWNTRYGEVHTIGFTYVASETKFYVYLDGVLQNIGGTLGPTTFLTNDWYIGDQAIGGGDASSCHKKIYNAGVFNRILTEAEHLKIHNKTVGKGVRNKGLLSINQLTNL